MKLRLLTFALIMALLSGLVLVPAQPTTAAPTPTATPQAAPSNTVPIAGTILTGGTFSGTVTLEHFFVQDGHLFVTAALSGTLTGPLGVVIGTVSNVPIILPVAGSGTCPVLDLVLGPLRLNLLGLVVTLNRVHLTITAVPGPGNLLGNLVCAITHLLDTGGPLSEVAFLLNQGLKLI